MIWQERPFPDANLLLLHGPEPVLVDSGFVGHAAETLAWTRAHAGHVCLVVNTHWHSDHVGGNALLQARGAAIAASAADADAVARRDPGCCLAEYLDQPVGPYTVEEALEDTQLIRLGEADWQVVAMLGHTPGHLCLWQPEERLLVVGDALSDYDVGWVNLALDGPDATATAVASLQRLADLRPRALLTAHGPLPADPGAAFGAALRRAQRLLDDPDGAVWYGARRILAFALMIRGGIPDDEIEPYLHERAWLTDAARLLDRTPEALTSELMDTMSASGAILVRDGRVHATAEHGPVTAQTQRIPFPRAWPPAGEPPLHGDGGAVTFGQSCGGVPSPSPRTPRACDSSTRRLWVPVPEGRPIGTCDPRPRPISGIRAHAERGSDTDALTAPVALPAPPANPRRGCAEQGWIRACPNGWRL